jgi:hypothetical protein
MNTPRTPIIVCCYDAGQKNITYLLAPDETKSCFINELIRDIIKYLFQKATTEDIMSMNPNCPRCKKWHISFKRR